MPVAVHSAGMAFILMPRPLHGSEHVGRFYNDMALQRVSYMFLLWQEHVTESGAHVAIEAPQAFKREGLT